MLLGKIQKQDKINGTQWYDEYFQLEQQIEDMQEKNKKMEREIQRRTDRYIDNEREYREEIN